MTCIVAVSDGDRVHMGGDSCVAVGEDHMVCKIRKVWNPRPGMAVGVAGHIAFFELLQDRVDWPAELPERGLLSAVRVRVGDAIRKAAGDVGMDFAQDDEDDVEQPSGSFIIGVHGKIIIGDNASVFQETGEPFAAIGTGGAYARSLLWHTRGKHYRPKTRLKAALEAAEHYSLGVRGPWSWAST